MRTSKHDHTKLYELLTPHKPRSACPFGSALGPRQRVLLLIPRCSQMQKPHDVLREMARIGKRMIVSIPNFGHWQVRLNLLTGGRMPETGTLSASWYETANIHLCTLLDFNDLCDTLGLSVDRCITLSNGRARHISGPPGKRHNLLAEMAVYLLKRG